MNDAPSDRAQRLRDRALQVLAQTEGQAGAGKQAAVPSPCVSVCQMDAACGWCRGCLRTLEEIARWSQGPAAAQREVWQRIADRALLGLPLE